MKILLTASPIDHSCQQNLELYAGENVTDLGSNGTNVNFILKLYKNVYFCVYY